MLLISATYFEKQHPAFFPLTQLFFTDLLFHIHTTFFTSNIKSQFPAFLFLNPWYSVKLTFSAPSLASIKTCSCFFFPKTLQAVSFTFSAFKLASSRNPLLIFLLLISTMDFEKETSYFSTSNPAFSQAYFLRYKLRIRRTWLVECQVIKTWQFSGFAFSALLFVFKIAWKSSTIPFSAPKLAISRNSLLLFLLLISTTGFEKATSYFSTSNSAFSQAYVLRV